jgi:hypothetical protein
MAVPLYIRTVPIGKNGVAPENVTTPLLFICKTVTERLFKKVTELLPSDDGSFIIIGPFDTIDGVSKVAKVNVLHVRSAVRLKLSPPKEPLTRALMALKLSFKS